jgi:hypothetical protein
MWGWKIFLRTLPPALRETKGRHPPHTGRRVCGFHNGFSLLHETTNVVNQFFLFFSFLHKSLKIKPMKLEIFPFLTFPNSIFAKSGTSLSRLA